MSSPKFAAAVAAFVHVIKYNEHAIEYGAASLAFPEAEREVILDALYELEPQTDTQMRAEFRCLMRLAFATMDIDTILMAGYRYGRYAESRESALLGQCNEMHNE